MTIGLPIAVATILALPIHTSMSETAIEIGHFAVIRPIYFRYSEVRAITVVDGLRLRDGSLRRRPAIVLDFSDGTRWSSADNRDPEKTIDESLLTFLQQKTKLPPQHIDAFSLRAN